MQMSRGTGKVRDLKSTVSSENREDYKRFSKSLQIHKLGTQKHEN